MQSLKWQTLWRAENENMACRVPSGHQSLSIINVHFQERDGGIPDALLQLQKNNALPTKSDELYK